MTEKTTHSTARRIAQIIAGLNIIIVFMGIIAFGLFLFNGLAELNVLAVFTLVLSPVNIILYSVLAVLILTRQPRHTVGWLFLIYAFFLSFASLSNVLSALLNTLDSAFAIGLIYWVAQMTWFPWFYIPISLMLLYFPDGHLPSRRWWPVATAATLSLILIELGNAIPPTWEENGEEISNIFGIQGSEAFLNAFQIIIGPLFLIGILGSLASVIIRFRRSRGVERAQIKWLVYVASIGISTLMFFILFVNDETPILGPLYAGLPILLPTLWVIAMGPAILRYRLFDIDIIIRRTLVYGLLTAILVALYFGLVVLLQSLVAAVGSQQSPIIIVISTLVIAAVFNPLRKRIQDLIDRRFYRRRYDAEEILAGFSLTAREEVDLESLSLALLRVVDNTMQPESVSVWLKDTPLIPSTGEEGRLLAKPAPGAVDRPRLGVRG